MFLLLTFMPQSEYYFGNYLYEQNQYSVLFFRRMRQMCEESKAEFIQFSETWFFIGNLSPWALLKVTIYT